MVKCTLLCNSAVQHANLSDPPPFFVDHYSVLLSKPGIVVT